MSRRNENSPKSRRVGLRREFDHGPPRIFEKIMIPGMTVPTGSLAPRQAPKGG